MAANLQRLRATYLRLREVQRSLNSRLIKTLTKRGLAQSARELGVWDGERIVVQHEDHLAVVADYTVYEHRFRGKNAIEQFIEDADVHPVADEARVLDAMLKARFTLVQVERIVPEVGALALDHVYGKRFLLADVSLATTGASGTLLATRRSHSGPSR